MSFFLLDTDTSIFLLNQSDRDVERRLHSLGRDEVGIATITLAELYYGAAHSKRREANEKRVQIFGQSLTLCPFDEVAARCYGSTRELLLSQGKLIGVMDLLIAAIAVTRQAILVTHNVREFRRVPSLHLEDWFPDI